MENSMESLVKFKAGWVRTTTYRVKQLLQKFVDGNLVEEETVVPKQYAVYAVLESNAEKLAEIETRLTIQGEEYYEQEGITDEFVLNKVENDNEFAGCTTFIAPQKLFTCGNATIGISKSGARAGKMFCNLEEDTTKSDDMGIVKREAFKMGIKDTDPIFITAVVNNLLGTCTSNAGKDDMDYLRLKSRKTAPVVENKPKVKAKKADPKEAEL